MRTTLQAARRDAGAADRAGVERVRYGVPRTSTRRGDASAPAARRARASIGRSRKTSSSTRSKKGQIDGLVVRLPDFYGPGADNSLANPIFRAALAGKTANWIGPVNTPHEFVYVPDTGPVIVESGGVARLLRRGLELRRTGQINTMDFITRVYRAVGARRSIAPSDAGS